MPNQDIWSKLPKTMTKTTSELRSAFLEFFKRHDHTVVKSGPLVLVSDPTLMFANAGMNQFKDVFTGREVRDYTRATTSQKCIRISGKHNDLEAVGPSPRHHTFFEMLGNFSFGDYFKEEAIVFAWEFLVKELGLSTDRLVFTYFEGDAEVPEDAVARDLWKKLSGFGDERVRPLGRDDNFWSMGDTGPCGPCSEIYFYNGGDVDVNAFGQPQTPEGEGIHVRQPGTVAVEHAAEAVSHIIECNPIAVSTGQLRGRKWAAEIAGRNGIRRGIDLLP